MTSTHIDPTTPERARIETFEQLAATTDEFEAYTSPHAARVAKLGNQLAELFRLGAHDRSSLHIAALAHDLGEAAMQRDYIKRTSALSAEERRDLARHPVIGEQEAARAGADRAAQLLVRWHHEWWNGGGYPDALRGEHIPLMSRILRVADAYAALTEARPFRPARTPEEARQHLVEWAGLEFDPEVVRAFLALGVGDERPLNAQPEYTDAMRIASAANPRFAFAENHRISSTDSFSPTMPEKAHVAPNSWLAFDLSVLRRLKFRSIALPLVEAPALCDALRRAGVRVSANSTTPPTALNTAACLVHSDVRLSEADVETLLEDAYVPGYKLRNQSLRKWFAETDAWWFDNVRAKVDELATEAARTQALSLGLMVGDYAQSFNAEARVLRQPLSKVFHRLWNTQAVPANNSQPCSSEQREARDFIAGQHDADLLFLRLSRAPGLQCSAHRSWREDWIRGDDKLGSEVENSGALMTGTARVESHAESKNQYLRYVEELLQTALHIRTWAIAYTEDGFVSTSELVETIARLRKVETIYTKDFSELMGARATIITA